MKQVPVPPTFLSLPAEIRFQILKYVFLLAAIDDRTFRSQGGYHSYALPQQRSGWAGAPNVHILAIDLIASHPALVSDICSIQTYIAGLFEWLEPCPLCESWGPCDPGPLFLDAAGEEQDDGIDMNFFGL